MNAMGLVQSKWRPKSVTLRWHGTHCVHTLMNVRKMKILSYIYILFLHRFTSFLFIICEVLMQILLNKRRRKGINRHIWLLRSTDVSMTWRQSSVTSANQLFHLSVTSLSRNVVWTKVFPRRSKISSFKEAVGGCKYYGINRNSGPISGLAGHLLLPHKSTHPLSFLNSFFCNIKYF